MHPVFIMNGKQPTPATEHRRVLWALVCGIALPLLDTTIVGVALPDLATSLGAPISGLQWVAGAYTLAAACTVTLCAWASRRFGCRSVWIAGLALFAAGSLAAALSGSLRALIAARAVQGMGAGAMLPVMQAILVQTVGPDRVKSAMTAAAVPAVVAPIAGPVVAGLLLQSGHWQLVFWLNIPVVCLALGLALRCLERDAGSRAARFDGPGFLLLAPALVLTLWGFSGIGASTQAAAGQGLALSSAAAVAAVLAGALFFACFGAHVRGLENPLLDLGLLRRPSFRATVCLLSCSGFVAYGGMFLFPLMLVQAGGQTALGAGLLVALQGLGALLSRSGLDAACRRLGVANTALIAIAGSAVGLGTLLLPGTLQSASRLGAALLLHGAGLGLLTLLAMAHAYHGLERRSAPDASALARVALLLGASAGTASVALLQQTGPRVGGAAFAPALCALWLAVAACTLPALALRRIQ